MGIDEMSTPSSAPDVERWITNRRTRSPTSLACATAISLSCSGHAYVLIRASSQLTDGEVPLLPSLNKTCTEDLVAR